MACYDRMANNGLMLLGLFIIGLLVMTAGAEILVRGAVGLARAAGISTLVVGLTVVAFGTSAPELAVSIRAGLAGQADIAIGNVLGSNVFNVLFILGLSAIIVPLAASQQLVRMDVPVMIGVSLLAWALASDGTIGRIDGIGLFPCLVLYTVVLIVLGRKQRAAKSEDGPPADIEAMPTRRQLMLSLIFVVAGLGLLVIGARWLVDGAVGLVRAMGVSDMLIGATIVAAGTSMPEVITSVMASIRGQRDIAIGNVVGSNIFNLLGVLGASAALAPSGINVAPEAIRFDFPILIAVAIACLPIFISHGRISPWEGMLFLLFYVMYVVFVILASTQHQAMGTFGNAMVWFVIPLTGLGLGVSLYMARRQPSLD